MTNEELRAAAEKIVADAKIQKFAGYTLRHQQIETVALAQHYLSTVQHDDGQECFAWRELSGAIDIDSIAETEDGVRLKLLEGSMGWRFEHPARYNQNDEWKRLQAYGSVVPVVVRKRVEALGGQ